MMWYYGGAGWGGFWVMALSMVLWFGVLSLLIWGLVRWLGERSATPTAVPPSALEVLHQRFARGEIDAPTYRAMRAELEGRSEREPLHT